MPTYMLMSGFLTDNSINSPEYYNLPKFEYSKLDQLLSSLCTLKKIDLDFADIYIDYDHNYSQFKETIEIFIRENFQKTNLRLFPYRLENFDQWVFASERIPKEATTLLLMNNLDHVFVPESNQDFKTFIKFLESKNPRSIGCIMHWQEFITGIGVKKFGALENGEPVFHNKACRTWGTVLTTPEFFKSWWQIDFTKGSRIVRPDNPFGPGVKFEWTDQFIPAREFFRHLDGYGHNGLRSPQAAPLRPCCQYLEGSIIHTDWIRGFSKDRNADLPLERPKNIMTYSNSDERKFDFEDYLVSANSLYFRLLRSIQLLQPKTIWVRVKLTLIILSLLKHNYMRGALYKFIFSFSTHKFRIRYFFAIKYSEFQSANKDFPLYLSELFLLNPSKLIKLILKSLFIRVIKFLKRT